MEIVKVVIRLQLPEWRLVEVWDVITEKEIPESKCQGLRKETC
jgi:hypothetical protein